MTNSTKCPTGVDCVKLRCLDGAVDTHSLVNQFVLGSIPDTREIRDTVGTVVVTQNLGKHFLIQGKGC